MITGELKDWKNFKELRIFKVAFEFLEDKNILKISPGKYLIDDNNIYAVIIKAQSRPIESAKFESHQKYIDLQYLISGREIIGFSHIDKLKVSKPYDNVDDFALYNTPNDYTKLYMHPGKFAVFFPEDGHMPNCHLKKQNSLHKVVIKIAINWYNNLK